MNRGVVWFLILAFAGAWIPWEIAIRLGVAATSPAFQLYGAIGAFAPAAACFIVRKWITREGFGDAGLRLNLRRRWPYYLAGWLLPLIVVAFIVIEANLFSVAAPDLSAQAGLQTLESHLPIVHGKTLGAVHGVNPWILITLQFLAFAIVMTPVLWGEEFGWRSYLQIRIFPEQPLRAAVATGLIWAVWHYPLILRGYDYPQSPMLGAAVFAVGTVLISIVFGWLRLRTQSIWASSLAHSATNVVGGGLTTLWFSNHADAVLVGYLGILAWVPLGLLCLWIVATGQLRPATASKGLADD